MPFRSTVRIITEADLRAAVALDLDAVACVEQAFVALAGGGVVMPPILRLDIHDANGEVDVKTAYVPGIDSFDIKISPGFFDNPRLGLPSVNGLMTVFSAKTGLLEAVLLDNGYLTDVRTAAAGAVAAKHLARRDARRAAMGSTDLRSPGSNKPTQYRRNGLMRSLWPRHPASPSTSCAKRASLPPSVQARSIANLIMQRQSPTLSQHVASNAPDRRQFVTQ